MNLQNTKRTILAFSLACLTASPTLAQDMTPDPEEFVVMPDEYYEAEAQMEREKRLEEGDKKNFPGYVPGYQLETGLGLSPEAPALSPGVAGLMAPSPGSRLYPRGHRFEFHGYLQPAIRMGIGKGDGGNATTLHADPITPGGSWGWFDHTNTVPSPWAQLNFKVGNDVVSATAILGAWSVSKADEAAGSFMPNAQVLFSDVYLTYTPSIGVAKLKINAGAFPDKYGFMAKWHQGAYGVSLIGDIYGMGATAALELPFEGDFDVLIEGGFKGELDKIPLGAPPEGSNEHAMAEEGSTFAGHGHLGIHFAKYFTPAVHFIYSFSNDDRKDLPDMPYTLEYEPRERKDGSLMILGADLRIDAGRFGYLYLGGSHIVGEHVNSLTNLVRVLNSGGGKELNEHFWGYESGGNGTMTLGGLQYSISLGTLLRHPMPYWGVGPDLVINLFGIYGWTTSEAPGRSDQNMLKYGAEALYSFSKMMAASFRFDHVMPDLDNQHRSFAVFSPQLTLRSDWNTRESLSIRYSYYATGSDVIVRGDNRLTNTASRNPDEHMVAVYGTIWW